jgi:hypothetical protein
MEIVAVRRASTVATVVTPALVAAAMLMVTPALAMAPPIVVTATVKVTPTLLVTPTLVVAPMLVTTQILLIPAMTLALTRPAAMACIGPVWRRGDLRARRRRKDRGSRDPGHVHDIRGRGARRRRDHRRRLPDRRRVSARVVGRIEHNGADIGAHRARGPRQHVSDLRRGQGDRAQDGVHTGGAEPERARRDHAPRAARHPRPGGILASHIHTCDPTEVYGFCAARLMTRPGDVGDAAQTASSAITAPPTSQRRPRQRAKPIAARIQMNVEIPIQIPVRPQPNSAVASVSGR